MDYGLWTIIKGEHTNMLKKITLKNKCFCGSGLPYSECHGRYDEAMKAAVKTGRQVPKRSLIKTKAQLEAMRDSAKINIAVLDLVGEKICAGMTTEDIDRIVYEKTKEMGGIPAPLNYEGFPKSVCVSVNSEVCHGIPSPKRVLKDGDIVNVDASTILDGFYSDSSRMYCIGNVSPENKRLVEVTKECVYRGLEKVKPLGYLGDVGAAVEEHAKKNGYSVVRQIGGHGIGLEFHEDPWVSFVSRPRTGMLLIPGLCFTIEPMINMGSARIYTDKKNGWTVYTQDGKPSAQWEIMVAVTDTGYEIISY